MPLLAYESQLARVRPPAWVVLIVGVYALLLVGLLALPAILYCFAGADAEGVFYTAMFVGLLVIAGFGLILVPVRVATRRPVVKKSWAFVLVSTGLAFGLLVFGGLLAAIEWSGNERSVENAFVLVVVAACTAWAGWAVLFWCIGKIRGPEQAGSKLYRWILAGSVLELLIALPAHLVVRKRTECCAGIATGMGLALGFAVMLVAMGPSVAMLYYRRTRQLKPAVPRPAIIAEGARAG